MSLFTEIATGVPSIFPQKSHPLSPPDETNGQPVETNKFYGNMLLGDRTSYAYPLPYSIWWTNTSNFYGLGISHCDQSDRVLGPDSSANPVDYFFMPSGNMSLCLGAAQFTSAPTFSTRLWGPLSLVARLTLNNGYIDYPICNGMGFVTAVYQGLVPEISSQIGFTSVGSASVLRTGVTKVQLTLENQCRWNLYISSSQGNSVRVSQVDSQHIQVNSTEAGLVVQVAKLGDSSWEQVIDSAAGAYATSVQLDGGITSDYGTAVYSLKYALSGSSTGGGTLIYAAPHHYNSFTSTMNGKVTNYQLASPTIGNLTLCVTSVLEMYERLPKDVGFLPWTVNKQAGDSNFSISNFSSSDIDTLDTAINSEISNVDIASATNLSSMYFSGKVLDKYAFILLVTKYIVKNDSLAEQILASLKSAFSTFTQNKQQTPLFYDQSWKGVVSQAGINDAMADFGNTYYNDHHFHYGYFIHAAAIVGKVDQDLGGSWATDNKDWVNSLVRDIATYGSDTTFPISRNFDWYQGHSLAKGLFASADGKDEESSSEDYHSNYGIKLWGSVIGDKSMEARANLTLAISRRAMNMYMLYESSNTTEPSQFIGNKVSGIKFENKIDHTTYFGTNTEYIQGIHMIPITPISSYIRSPTFVKEEWDAIIASIVSSVDSGWKGILQLNRALYDASSSYSFFSDSSFQTKWLDDGLSLTWALAFSKGVE